MVIRISRARIRPGTEGDVFARLRAASKALGRPDGLEAVFIGRHLTAEGLEVAAITVWRDAETMISVLGEGWEQPKWLDGIADLVTDSRIEHFETAHEDFDPSVGLEAIDVAKGSGPASGSEPVDGQVYGG